jgi:hypothetical protein
VAVLVSFSDEAAVPNPEGDFLVAGYVGRDDLWPWVVRAWQDRVLDGPPKIPYFRMKHIRSDRWRRPLGFSYNHSEGRVSEAVNIMRSTGSLWAVFYTMREPVSRRSFIAGSQARRRFRLGWTNQTKDTDGHRDAFQREGFRSHGREALPHGED